MTERPKPLYATTKRNSVAAKRATIGFRVLPPNELATFGDLAKQLAGLHVANHRLEMQTFEEVLEEVRPIVAKALGVDRSQVVAEARFVQDLGMG